MPTEKKLANLVLNDVPSIIAYNNMKSQGLVKSDEIYLIDESNQITPYTTLTNNANSLRVNLHDIDNHQDYKLVLMTMCRRRGNKHGEWYKIDEHSPTGNRQPTYGSLIGKKVYNTVEPPLYQQAPAWMPNGGYLQTEIELTNASFVDIDISQYFLPILKPPLQADTFTTYKVDENNNPLQYATIIGVNQRTKAPKLFKFCLQKISNGEIFQCKNILRIGGRYLKDLTSTEVVDIGNGQTIEKTKKYFGVTVKINKSDPTKAYIKDMYKSIISM